MNPIPATRAQWEGFVQSIVWIDLKQFMSDTVLALLEDLVEGQKNPEDESDDILRGRIRCLRELSSYIEGWADGSIPIESISTETVEGETTDG